jgi:hydroxypyruvate isomerase
MHVQLEEGDITHCIQEHIGYIANVHLESVPDRGEPGTGELNDRHVVTTLTEAGFSGSIIFEYTPDGPTADSLRRVMDYLC